MTGMIEQTLRRTLDFLTLGGPVVAILLAVSVISLTLVILKIWQFCAARVGRHRTIEKALAHWTAGGQRIALADLAERRNGAARLVWQAMATVINASPRDSDAISERLRVDATAYLAKLRSGFRALDAEMSIRRRKCLDFLARPRSHDLLLLGSSRVFAISMSRAATRGIASVALQAQQNS